MGRRRASLGENKPSSYRDNTHRSSSLPRGVNNNKTTTTNYGRGQAPNPNINNNRTTAYLSANNRNPVQPDSNFRPSRQSCKYILRNQ